VVWGEALRSYAMPLWRTHLQQQDQQICHDITVDAMHSSQNGQLLQFGY
jgi:hypothetical protein